MQTLYQTTRQRLRESGIDRAEQEARLLIKHVFGVSDADILTSSPLEQTGQNGDAFESLIQRRLSGEPLSRILGTQEFWSLPFLLSPDTLDPRADTEVLVQAALDRFTGNPPERILDIGTGTGCIPIALLTEWPNARAVATDLSAGAIETARKNAEINNVADRIDFVQTRWAAGVMGPFDLIVSNPPYIPSAVIPNLSAQVKNYDPILALDGGNDGLDAYRSILTEIKTMLEPGGFVFFEIGYDQGESVPRLVEEYGANLSRLISDLEGIPRVVECHMGISVKTMAADS